MQSWVLRARASALACALWVAAAAPAPALDDPADRMRETVLDNGLTVLTLEDRTTPVVSFQIWVRAGSKDETRYTGIAHLFEHMMFKGSANLAPERHAQLVEARGGRVNAFTSRDVTVYFEDVTPDALPLVIDLEYERFANLDLGERMLSSEREVVLEERGVRTESDPSGRAFEAIFSLVWQAHEYRWPVIGWRSDVANVTLEACREFFDTYYAPDNLVIAVAGDFDTEETLAHLRRTFGRLEPAGDIARNVTEEPEQDGPRRAEVYFDVRSPLLMAAWHAPATGHEDAEALDVAGEILSTGRSSRLYRRLVYREQKALAASGGYWELDEAGVFFAYASVRPGVEVGAVEALFMDEIARLRDAPVSAAELEKAKVQLEVRLVSGLRTTHALASRIARDTVAFGRVRPLEERLEAIRAVTAEDVQRVARTYLVDARRSTVHLVAPPGPADAP